MISKVLYILGQLSDDDADWLGRAGRRLRLDPGDILIERGVRLEELYFVLDGELQVLSPHHEEIARVGPGDLLGELSLLDDNPTSADVIARTGVQVLSVSSACISDRMTSDPGFATRFYKAISMLLALRMRATLSRFGAGDAPQTVVNIPAADAEGHDEAHERAAQRFERMLRSLWGIGDSRRS